MPGSRCGVSETSQARGELHLGAIALPSLVIQSTGDTGVFPSDARAIFAALGASDKSLEMPAGAHYFEDTPNGRDLIADMIAGWLDKRI